MLKKRGRTENLTNIGKGRKRGVKNRFTTLKQAFLDTFQEIGGEKGLSEWANKTKNRRDFYRMLSKMLPSDVGISGPGGAPIEFTNLERAAKLAHLIEKALQIKSGQLSKTISQETGKELKP